MRIHVGTQVSVIESCLWEKSLWCYYERLRKVRVAIVQEKALIVMGEIIRNPLQLRALWRIFDPTVGALYIRIICTSPFLP